MKHAVAWNIDTTALSLDESQLENLACSVLTLQFLQTKAKGNGLIQAACHSDCAITPYALTCASSAFCHRQMGELYAKSYTFITLGPPGVVK